jgi:hypothetical protein
MVKAKKLGVTLIVSLLMLIALVGCASITNTGQTSNDAAAVQQYFPTLTGYNTTPATDIVNAFNTVASGASLATGGVVGAAALNRINALITCYRDVGAADARIYTRIALPPEVGVLLIVNQDRAIDNFLSCATSGFGSQSATREPQPCVGSGQFTAQDNTFFYVYAASTQEVCTGFTNHFRNFSG